MDDNILSIRNLTVEFDVQKGNQVKKIKACNNVSLDIKRGEAIGIIGESGSGKSTLTSAILNLIQSPGKITGGSVKYFKEGESEGDELIGLPSQLLNKFRWEKIACVFQAAQNALNPIMRVKDHFLDTVAAHNMKLSREEILTKAKQNLEMVRLNDYVLEYFPYQLSGGMRQRVLIALSMICDPEIIIFDEPTTALDVITQKYIMDILKGIQKERKFTFVFLTHDISIIGYLVDRLAIMYAGKIVEIGKKAEMFLTPRHPYSFGLMNAIPNIFEKDLSVKRAIPGSPPDLAALGEGCAFSERCFLCLNGTCSGGKENLCEPPIDIGDGHYTVCKFSEVKSL